MKSERINLKGKIKKTPYGVPVSAFVFFFILAYIFTFFSFARAADLYPGNGFASSASATTNWSIPLLVSPAAGATGVSRCPSLQAVLRANATVQYQFQVDSLASMDSIAGSPLYNFDQTISQAFSQGAFAGQNAVVSVSSDAYLAVSTAAFTFYSGTQAASVPLSANTKYYFRARATNYNGTFSLWTSTRSFTTGEFASTAPINSVAITNIYLSTPTAAGTIAINFSISENNVSTGTTPNGGAYNTADWIFVKFSTQAGADGTWNHAVMGAGGGVGAGANLTVAADNMGVFLNHTASQSLWASTVTLIWNYAASGALPKQIAVVKVFSISMMKIPSGGFVYNVSGIGGNGSNNYGGGAQANVSSVNDLPAGATTGWPNGYSSFYIMRYEISQGQYAAFLNALPSAAAAPLYEPTVSNGHNMTYASENPYGSMYAAVNPNAAKSYMSTGDVWSFLSWAALRPPTELEFEKASRDLLPDARGYPWGSTVPGALELYSPANEGGVHAKYYLNYKYASVAAPVTDVGRYMSGDVYRTQAQTGASLYGIADLAGNVWEHVLNCSYSAVPSDGNGTLAWPANWPAVNSAQKGLRGGSTNYSITYARISDRTNISYSDGARLGAGGARGVRTQ